jgi:hypothetical protein
LNREPWIWRGAYRVLSRNLRKRDLGLNGDNIEMDLKEIGWG